MGGEIHNPQCDVPYCRCSPEAWHHGVKMCAPHWSKVSHATFKTLTEADKGFGTKDGMPAWEAARTSVIAEASAVEQAAEQMALI